MKKTEMAVKKKIGRKDCCNSPGEQSRNVRKHEFLTHDTRVMSRAAWALEGSGRISASEKKEDSLVSLIRQSGVGEAGQRVRPVPVMWPQGPEEMALQTCYYSHVVGPCLTARRWQRTRAAGRPSHQHQREQAAGLPSSGFQDTPLQTSSGRVLGSHTLFSSQIEY